MQNLSKRQSEVLEYITDFQEKNNYSPSLSEIASFFNVSTPTIHQHVSYLEKKGFITRPKHKKRYFHVKKNDSPFKEIHLVKNLDAFTVPILGAATAGDAKNYAKEDVEGHLKIPKNTIKFKKDLFAIRIDGNSMNRAKIKDTPMKNGNFVIIDPEYQTPKDGEYVLSVVDGCANIKKFKRDLNGIQLISESTEKIHKPIFISSDDNYMVNGKVVAVIKK